ncbi:hypothetical protein ACL02T_02765 [Pseudonocardia sp. RS010]|uniref:hypothetical protein n=1 Tax=Pseudonocardia sp. RS010 TaxID=3385979 RepID=UPI00399F53BD
MDDLSANKTPKIRAWARAHNVERCFTPTYASWANPIEAQFGPLRNFVMGASNPDTRPATAGLSALAQRQRPSSRRPRGPTPRTRPSPQRTPPPLGQTRRRMTR